MLVVGFWGGEGRCTPMSAIFWRWVGLAVVIVADKQKQGKSWYDCGR